MSDITDKNNIKNFAKQLKKLSNTSEVESALKYSGVSKEFAKEALKNTKYSTDLANAINITSDSVGGLIPLLQKAGGALKTFAATPLGMASVVGIGAAVVALEDYFTIDYNEALEQSLGSIEKAQKSARSLQAINQELATTRQRILELYKLKNSGSISPIEEKELKNLEKHKDQLVQNDFRQEKISQSDQQKAELDAKKSLAAETQSVADSIRYGDPTGQKQFKGEVKNTTAIDALKDDAKLYTDYLDILKEDQKELKQRKDRPYSNFFTRRAVEFQEEKINTDKESIVTLERDMSEKFDLLTTQRAALANTEGNEDLIREIDVAFAEYRKATGIGLTKDQQKQLDIDSFFSKDSTSNIHDYLTEVAKTASSTKDIKDAINGLGLTAEDFGSASLNDVAQYFSNIAAAADDAADSVQNVDGTFSGIEAAFQTENSGDSYEKTGAYMLRAKEMVDEGRYNTDDVQSVAKMIGADTENIAGTFQQKYQEMMKYFTFDESGNMTEDGVNHFIEKYEGLEDTFQSTGETAKAMGLTVEAFEILMGRAQEHGIDFGDMIKSSEELENAKDKFAELQMLYDEMGTSSDNEEQMNKWKDHLAACEKELTNLDPTIIAQIEFAYNTAQLEQEVNDAKSVAEHGGDTGDWAEALAAQERLRSSTENALGFNIEGINLPKQYTDISETIDSLKEQLNSDLSEAEKLEIQAEISNLYDLQNDFLQAFAESEFAIGIDQDSTAEEWNAAMQGFLENNNTNLLAGLTKGVGFVNADTTDDLVANLDINDEAALKKLEEVFGLKENTLSFLLEVQDNASEPIIAVSEMEMRDKITTLRGEDEATQYVNLWNLMSADPKFSSLTADDQASKVVQAFDKLSPEDKKILISETGGKHSLSIAQSVADVINSIPPSSKTDIIVNKITNFINRVFNPTSSGSTIGKSAFSPAQEAAKALQGGNSPANGTAHYSGTALSSGNWGLPRSGRTLINELGSEIIVRNGHWFVLNGGYPTLANLRAGDIVFNHLQSADILKHGYVTGSHARMVGSARADGSAPGSGDALAIGSAYGLSGRALASGSKSKFSEQFDKIEILVDRMEAAFKRITQSVEGLSYNLTTQNAQVDAAISQARNNISAYQKAYQAYISKADSVGLSSSWKTTVQQGGYDIQEITDESLKNKINDYKKYYDKALKLQNDIADLQEKLLDLAVQKLKNIDSYYSNRFDFNDDFGYANQASQLQAALDAYLKELDRQVGAGTIKRYSDEWYDAQKKIADYTQKVLEAQWKKFENAIDHFSRVSSTLEDDLSFKKASGGPVSEVDYQKQIDINNQAIDESYAYRQTLVKKQAVYDVGSDLYDKLAKEIAGLDSDIYKLMEDNEKLKKSIWDIRFTDPFEEVTDHLEDTIASTKSFRSLLDKDAFFDPAGNLTDTGAANLALLNQEMTLSKQKIAEYTAALKKLDEAYRNGILTQEAHEKSQSGFLKEIRDAAGDVKDYKDDIIDLYKKQMKAEASYLDEYYEKRQKALRLDEKYYEFSRKLSSQSKSVNQLKAQIAALQGVKNASAQAQLRRLEQELMEEEADLRELKKDHADDMKDEGYDALERQLDKNLDDTLEELTYNADKQQQVVSDMLNNIVNMYGQAYGKIQQIIGDTGFTGGAGFQQNVEALGSASGAQGQVDAGNAHQGSLRPSDVVSGVNTGSINDNPSHGAILDDIRETPDIHNRLVAQITLSASSLSLVQGKSATVSAQIRPTDAANKTLTWTSSDPSVATASGGKVTALKAGSATILCRASDGGGAAASLTVRVTAAPAQTGSGSSASKGTGGIPFIPKKTYYPKNKLNINTSIVDRLAYHDYDSSSSARRKLYEYWGGQGYYSGTAAQNAWLLSKMKSAGYRKGSRAVPSTGHDFVHGGEIIIRKTDGGMLFPLKRGDGVIPTGLTENLWDLAERAPELLQNPGIHLAPLAEIPVTSAYQGGINAQFHFDNLLNIEGNADESLVDELKSILPTLGKDLTKIVSTELAQDYRKLK